MLLKTSSVLGEMSEKLRRCRKELTAAIDRAFEDFTGPSRHSEDSIKQNSDLQTDTLPQMNRVIYRREPASILSSYLDQSASVSCAVEKENPVFIPNLLSVSIAQNPLCPKREPLTSKENTWLHPSIFVPDRQLPRALGDSERWRKGSLRGYNLRMIVTGLVLFLRASSEGLVFMAFFLCFVGNPNIWAIEELGQLALANELSQVPQNSSEPPLREDILAVCMDASGSSVTIPGVRQRRPNIEDDEIIQTVLDLEEDYSMASSTLHQLN
uniref:Chromosome 3 open reading frame 62 n=1 Tax=Pelusios castaneus TaxID=367368 RepID=A0A8C8RRU7_9SAUR